jgi:hypothetical protein
MAHSEQRTDDPAAKSNPFLSLSPSTYDTRGLVSTRSDAREDSP